MGADYVLAVGTAGGTSQKRENSKGRELRAPWWMSWMRSGDQILKLLSGSDNQNRKRRL